MDIGKTMIMSRDNGGRNKKHITPADFFSNEADKIKLNWFLFEYALEVQSFIRRDGKLKTRLNRKGVDDKAIATFCIHYAKQMKSQVLDRVAGTIPNVCIGYEEIEALLPAVGDRLVDQILTKAADAWDSQVDACCTCATRCISEKDQRCTLFDDPDYYR